MTAPLSGHPVSDIRAILNNGWANSEGPVDLPYIFQAIIPSMTFDYTLTGLTSSQRTTFRNITEDGLAQMTALTGMTFTEASDAGDPASHIEIAYTPSLSFGGEAYHSYWDRTGDGEIETLRAEMDIRVYNYYTILHELGHVFTLLHTGPNQSPDHGPFFDTEYRNNNFTVMHYTNLDDGQGVGEWDYRYFQLLDVYALQLRFGKNMTTNAGNDVHDEASLWSADKLGYLQVLWDAGGIDTLDFSGFGKDQLIDLNEGAFSDVGSMSGAAPGLNLSVGDAFDMDYELPLYNLAVAYGAEIENAEGGSGDDMLIGNDLDNFIDGGAGGDLLFGDGYDPAVLAEFGL